MIPTVAELQAHCNGQLAIGCEFDIAICYDSVLHKFASAALLHDGAPSEIMAWLRQAWTAPKYCNVDSELVGLSSKPRAFYSIIRLVAK